VGNNVAPSAKPVFIGVRYAPRALGIWTGGVESRLGSPDAILRFGARDQSAWLQARIDNIIPRTEKPIVLYGRQEARRVVGISVRAAQRILNDDVGVAWFPGFGGQIHPLFHEEQLHQIRRRIKNSEIRIQTRSLKAPKFQAYLSEPRHTISEDVRIENERIQRLQAEPKFWAELV
jgi:hypothetical protein